MALACLFTPSFTTALNPLPPYLYSHGSAIMATLQQVAGAAGAALLVAIMSSRTATLIEAGQPELTALNGGLSLAFLVAAVVSIGAIVLAVFMRNPKPEPAEPEAQRTTLMLKPGRPTAPYRRSQRGMYISSPRAAVRSPRSSTSVQPRSAARSAAVCRASASLPATKIVDS